jgi:phage host-nuclease inhibitor protein Gam
MKIKSWDDVDMALAQIAAHKEAIAAAKGLVDERREKIGELEPRIEAFVREHEDELQERGKSLPHGRVWLRQATRLVARSWARVLERLLEVGLDSLVRVKQEPDKDALTREPDEFLEKIGVKRKTEDAFGYEAI